VTPDDHAEIVFEHCTHHLSCRVACKACVSDAIREAQEAARGFTCAVRAAGKTDPPQDCDWPFCGCDPHATKVVEALQESGALRARGESTPEPAPACSKPKPHPIVERIGADGAKYMTACPHHPNTCRIFTDWSRICGKPLPCSVHPATPERQEPERPRTKGRSGKCGRKWFGPFRGSRVEFTCTNDLPCSDHPSSSTPSEGK
jgi:hypothetical protein